MHEPSTGEKGGAGVDGVTRLLCENPLPPSPKQSTLLVTRTLSKAHSLAGFRVGYAILPVPVADDLNASNDTYPLARPSQAAAIATLRADAEIRNRIERLRSWTE
jgi:histidinol-phosphate aminotransferase